MKINPLSIAKYIKPILREIRSWAKIIKGRASISKKFHIWLSCSYCSITIHLWPYFGGFLIKTPEQEIVSSPRSKNRVQRSLNVNSIKTECSLLERADLWSNPLWPFLDFAFIYLKWESKSEYLTLCYPFYCFSCSTAKLVTRTHTCVRMRMQYWNSGTQGKKPKP